MVITDQEVVKNLQAVLKRLPWPYESLELAKDPSLKIAAWGFQKIMAAETLEVIRATPPDVVIYTSAEAYESTAQCISTSIHGFSRPQYDIEYGGQKPVGIHHRSVVWFPYREAEPRLVVVDPLALLVFPHEEHQAFQTALSRFAEAYAFNQLYKNGKQQDLKAGVK